MLCLGRSLKNKAQVVRGLSLGAFLISFVWCFYVLPFFVLGFAAFFVITFSFGSDVVALKRFHGGVQTEPDRAQSAPDEAQTSADWFQSMPRSSPDQARTEAASSPPSPDRPSPDRAQTGQTERKPIPGQAQIKARSIPDQAQSWWRRYRWRARRD